MNKQTEEALRMAIEAIEEDWHLIPMPDYAVKTINACKAALQEDALDRMAENARELGLDYDEQGCLSCVTCGQPVTNPLSDDEITKIAADSHCDYIGVYLNYARAIEKAHGIGE